MPVAVVGGQRQRLQREDALAVVSLPEGPRMRSSRHGASIVVVVVANRGREFVNPFPDERFVDVGAGEVADPRLSGENLSLQVIRLIPNLIEIRAQRSF